VTFTALGGGEALVERLDAVVRERSPEVTLSRYPVRARNAGTCHHHACFNVIATARDGTEHELADGGLVGWTQRLHADRKRAPGHLRRRC
jgi:hypothetical protein